MATREGSGPFVPASARQAPAWDQVTERRLATTRRADLEDLIAQLREANQNLVLAALTAQTLRDEAEAVNQRQTEFLAMLAHELRNPLAPIKGAATMIGKTPGASPLLLHLQAIIERQVVHLTRLLDDLLDAARISSGKITLQLLPVALADVIHRAVEIAQPGLAARRQQLVVEAPAAAVGIDGDQVRLTQVLTNLLINASKFTPEHGSIRILVTRLPCAVEVAVSDSGAGIAAPLLPHVFDLFTQGPRSLARAEGGLGIGLSIVRNIVQMHGGTVTASSAGLGRGSVFTVTLPLAAAGRGGVAVAAPAAPAAGAPCRILLVDDNSDASEVLAILFEEKGHTVSSAANGAAGLAMARAQVFDVLVCDIGMPEMDGLELARALRATAGAAQPLLLGLSGYGREQDRAAAMAAGFDGYFVKPVDIDALLAAIAARAAPRRR